MICLVMVTRVGLKVCIGLYQVSCNVFTHYFNDTFFLPLLRNGQHNRSGHILPSARNSLGHKIHTYLDWYARTYRLVFLGHGVGVG